MRLVLASASPRRRELLTAIGVNIDRIAPPSIEETRWKNEDPSDFARRMAEEKAATVACSNDEVVLAADTVVHLDGLVFGKPTDDKNAIDMLSRLSGRDHRVSTGWCIRTTDRSWSATTQSIVRFRPLSSAEIAAYVAKGEGQDKAGSYGIQGHGAALVAEVRGDHSNVVGLPLPEILPVLATLGIKP